MKRHVDRHVEVAENLYGLSPVRGHGVRLLAHLGRWRLAARGCMRREDLDALVMCTLDRDEHVRRLFAGVQLE